MLLLLLIFISNDALVYISRTIVAKEKCFLFQFQFVQLVPITISQIALEYQQRSATWTK